MYRTIQTSSFLLLTEQMGTTHTAAEAEEAMDIEAGQFEDAEEDP